MTHPVTHFEIIGRDAAALAKFYHNVFGWDISVPSPQDPMQYHLVDPVPGKNAGIRGGFGNAPEGYDGHVTFYIVVDDIESTFAKIEEHGGTRMMGPDHVPNGPVIGLFRDPEGRTIGVVDPLEQTTNVPMELMPFVYFYGRCREALEFYAEALGGSYDVVMSNPDGTISYSLVRAPGITFAASDGAGQRTIDPNEGNVSLSLSVNNPALAERTFAALAAGGDIRMPFGPAQWGGMFGHIHDKFGNEWFVTVPAREPATMPS